ncbi:MAG: DUF2281 domain-containing protein [Bacteroidia bacterium]
MDNLLYKKIELLPEELKKEVLDFVEFLLNKAKKEKTPVPDKTRGKSPRKAGSLKGTFKMAPDFDEPLDDFKEYMY